jgi:hypothetical protein
MLPMMIVLPPALALLRAQAMSVARADLLQLLPAMLLN